MSYKKYGVDLSYHNGEVDFQKLKDNNISFVILRIGYGVSGKQDSKLEDYYKKAKDVGLMVGGYYYSYSLTKDNATQEAKNCINFIGSKKFDLPIYLDMEDADSYKSKNGMPSNSTLVSICSTWCNYMEDKGYFVGVYASESWFNSQLKNLSNDYSKWVAKWGTNDGTCQADMSNSYYLHQYTSKKKINNSTYDANVLYYDYSSLIQSKGFNGYAAANATKYFKACSSSEDSLVDGLKSIGADSSYSYRKKIAAANGITSYSGSSSENLSLLKLLKSGKLKMPS